MGVTEGIRKRTISQSSKKRKSARAIPTSIREWGYLTNPQFVKGHLHTLRRKELGSMLGSLVGGASTRNVCSALKGGYSRRTAG